VGVMDVADVMDSVVRDRRSFSGEAPDFGASREAPNPSVLGSREKGQRGSGGEGEAPSGREAPICVHFSRHSPSAEKRQGPGFSRPRAGFSGEALIRDASPQGKSQGWRLSSREAPAFRPFSREAPVPDGEKGWGSAQKGEGPIEERRGKEEGGRHAPAHHDLVTS
jgi:hypothetical protein